MRQVFYGNDTLSGGDSGNDTIIGGAGNDYFNLTGGNGTDTFVFNSYNEGIDTIYGFNVANELIQISTAGFGGGLSSGSLQTNEMTAFLIRINWETGRRGAEKDWALDTSCQIEGQAQLVD